MIEGGIGMDLLDKLIDTYFTDPYKVFFDIKHKTIVYDDFNMQKKK